MFENLMNELHSLERGKTVRVTAEAAPDQDGFIERECPAETCAFIFKVHEDDWSERFRDEIVYCPRCGHSAASDKWWTKEQVDRAVERAKRRVFSQIDVAMRRDARAFNLQQPRDSFVRMKLSVSVPRLSPFILPAHVSDAWKLRIDCERCQARYAVIGAAYFCPCCGDNSVERTFDASLDRIRSGVECLNVIRDALGQRGIRDQGEAIVQRLLESSVQDCVTAIQRLFDAMYARLCPGSSAPRNVFQRLEGGSALWHSVIGTGYAEILSPDELAELGVLFQQRHLLSHTDGIVDEEYRLKSGDRSYRVGQRVVVKAQDVLRMALLVKRVADGIRGSTPLR